MKTKTFFEANGGTGMQKTCGTPPPGRSRRCGFTLIELLAVIGIIGILIAILVPTVPAVIKMVQKQRAQVAVKSIETAVRAYLNEYGKLPIPVAQQGGTDWQTTENYTRNTANATEPAHPYGSRWVIGVLANETVAAHVQDMNPRGLQFLELPTVSATPGEFLDPWEKQYEMKFDSNYDGVIVFSNQNLNAVSLRVPVLVMSSGPDKTGRWEVATFEYARDDILSFQCDD